MPKLKKFEEIIDQQRRDLKPEDLKKVYNYLEKYSDEAVTFLVEALVGIMRKMRLADRESVELYLKNYEGFVLAVSRINLRTLNPEFCSMHLKKLSSEYLKRIKSEEFKNFIPIYNLLKDVCFGGL